MTPILHTIFWEWCLSWFNPHEFLCTLLPKLLIQILLYINTPSDQKFNILISKKKCPCSEVVKAPSSLSTTLALSQQFLTWKTRPTIPAFLRKFWTMCAGLGRLLSPCLEHPILCFLFFVIFLILLNVLGKNSYHLILCILWYMNKHVLIAYIFTYFG